MIWKANKLSEVVNSLYTRMSNDLLNELLLNPEDALISIHSQYGDKINDYYDLSVAGNPLHLESIRYCEYHFMKIESHSHLPIDPDQIISIIIKLLSEKVHKNPRGVNIRGANVV